MLRRRQRTWHPCRWMPARAEVLPAAAPCSAPAVGVPAARSPPVSELCQVRSHTHAHFVKSRIFICMMLCFLMRKPAPYRLLLLQNWSAVVVNCICSNIFQWLDYRAHSGAGTGPRAYPREARLPLASILGSICGASLEAVRRPVCTCRALSAKLVLVPRGICPLCSCQQRIVDQTRRALQLSSYVHTAV